MKIIKLIKKHSRFVAVGLIVVLCAYLSAFHFQVVLIRGNSMYPTYRNLEFVLLNKHKTLPSHGEVIAFHSPEKGTLVKRVIGIPGDELLASEEGLIINGQIHPDYTDLNDYGVLSQGVVLTEKQYFVLGDNTKESRDSRYKEIGIVHSSQIYGTIIPMRDYSFEISE